MLIIEKLQNKSEQKNEANVVKQDSLYISDHKPTQKTCSIPKTKNSPVKNQENSKYLIMKNDDSDLTDNAIKIEGQNQDKSNYHKKNTYRVVSKSENLNDDSKPERKDFNGNIIKKHGKHRVTFRDLIKKGPLADLIYIKKIDEDNQNISEINVQTKPSIIKQKINTEIKLSTNAQKGDCSCVCLIF